MRKNRLLAGTILLWAFSLPASLAFSQAPEGWIQSQSWLFLGPLGNSAGCDPGKTAEENWIFPQQIAAIAPLAGERIDIDFASAASQSWLGAAPDPEWVCLGNLGFSGEDLVDLVAATAAIGAAAGETLQSSNVAALLVTYVTNRTDRPLPVTICSASDDSIQVWINDQETETIHACRPTASGCAEESFGLLRPGKNAIKILLWQGFVDWSFRLRLQHFGGAALSSCDGEVEFNGCDGTGPMNPGAIGPAEPAAPIVRSSVASVPAECRSPSPTLDVTLKSSEAGAGAPAGGTGPITIREEIIGAAGVEAVSHGGIFTPSPLPPASPVGIFDGASDIGSPGPPGSTVENGGLYTLSGTGLGVGGLADLLHFAHRLAHGDFTLTARVAARRWSAVGTALGGRAGILARQGFSGKSRFAFLETLDETIGLADRIAGRAVGGETSLHEETSLDPSDHRDWLRLVRTGNNFTGYFSGDGIAWGRAGSVDWGPCAPRTVLLGLAVASGSACNSAAVDFDQVDLQGGDQVPGSLAPEGGTIVWKDLTGEDLQSGFGYRLRGEDRVELAGDDGSRLVEGTSSASFPCGSAGPGIFEFAQDIGGPCAPGSTSFDSSSGAYTVTGSGKDVWAGNDQFQYAYREVSGDFSIRAHLLERSWVPGQEWGKAGIMTRESCFADARYSAIEDSPCPDPEEFEVQRYTSQNSNQAWPAEGHDDWLRLDRAGDVVSGYVSADGVAWRLVHAEAWRPPVPGSLLVGLEVLSHADCAAATVVFDQVRFAPPGPALARSVEGLDGCRRRGETAKVILQGKSLSGSDLIVREEIRGQVEVKNISHGGAFVPFPEPERHPVGRWLDARDLGHPPLAGSTIGSTLDNGDGSYTVTGGGVGLEPIGDLHQFAYVDASGDFSLTARLADRHWAEGSRGGKGGLMARQSLDPRARQIAVEDLGLDPEDSTRLESRGVDGEEDLDERALLPTYQHHDWLRLERRGNMFIGSSSLDGSLWVELGRRSWLDAPATILLGLAVTSHRSCDQSAIRFDAIDLEGGDGPPGAVAAGGAITWSVPPSALEEGLAYEVSAPGAGLASFRGWAGLASDAMRVDATEGTLVAGAGSVHFSAVEDLGGDLPEGREIGGSCAPGAAAYDPAGNTYLLSSSGRGVLGASDQLHFAYRAIEGESFVAQVHISDAAWADRSQGGAAGILLREDCAPSGRSAFIHDSGEDPQSQNRFDLRATAGASDLPQLTDVPPGTHNRWLRLVRTGTSVAAFTSPDGAFWTRTGFWDFDPPLAPRVLLGLAVASNAAASIPGGCDAAAVQFEMFRLETEANHPPVACCTSDPAPAVVQLEGGQARLTLDGRCSGDGDGGRQSLAFAWSLESGPEGAAAAIADGSAPLTEATFTAAGAYRLRLTVDDGAILDHLDHCTIEVTVKEEPAGPRFRRGDADASGTLDLNDPSKLLDYLFLGSEKPECLDAADIDDDGRADISDAIRSLYYQFLGGPPPAPPGPTSCGVDPTEETPELGCAHPCS